MKPLLIAIAITLGTAATGLAQCPNCQPAQPSAGQSFPNPSVVIVKQRLGLFGWRCRWVVVPTETGTAPAVMILR